MQDLELAERYVIEQSYYEGFKHAIISERLNCDIANIRKISTRALKKVRTNLCNLGVGITNKDKLKKGVF